MDKMDKAYLQKKDESDERVQYEINFYHEFQKKEAIPVYEGYHFEDIRSLEVKPWARMGGLGAYINVTGEYTTSDNYLCEIPPGGTLNPQKHLFEELVYVVSGRGATTFWAREGGPRWTFEWNEHSLFALPANVGYQHFNGDSTKPARLLSKTNLPTLMRTFRSEEFIFENTFVFENINKKFYSAEAKTSIDATFGSKRINWDANFVPDVRAFDKMTFRQERGAGDKSVRFTPSSIYTMFSHQSEFRVGTYKKAHAHPPGRTIILITGTGYSLLWQDGFEKEKVKVDWSPGSIIGVALNDLQGEIWWHQHFNTGKEPARYLVLHNHTPQDKHVQIDYCDQDPDVKKLFESELAIKGIKSQMPPEVYTDPNFKFKPPK